MARDQVILPVPKGTWVQLTNADATVATFQCQSGRIAIRGTTDETEPAEDAGGIIYNPHEGERQKNLATLFAAAGIDRLWAFGLYESMVYIDHA